MAKRGGDSGGTGRGGNSRGGNSRGRRRSYNGDEFLTYTGGADDFDF